MIFGNLTVHSVKTIEVQKKIFNRFEILEYKIITKDNREFAISCFTEIDTNDKVEVIYLEDSGC